MKARQFQLRSELVYYFYDGNLFRSKDNRIWEYILSNHADSWGKTWYNTEKIKQGKKMTIQMAHKLYPLAVKIT